ncbi:MAG: hypothetical protein GVY19_08275 [Bacteroidetes bacterium]|jgi:uncharacterized Fe-S cluster protein YjdI|nr:hypothetical protein [Bacteroidota bacterium]
MSFLDDDRNREYKNKDITVYWKPAKCIHATTCYKELIEVFNPRKRPWVNMDGATTEKIIEVVDQCPTAALEWKYNKDVDKQKGNQTLKTEKVAEVKVMADGPLVVRGNFRLEDHEGNEIKKMRIVSICRCGQSGDMPFCDGTHRKVGFEGK